MTESHPAQSARAFFWLASLIVGGLLFAVGIMVGRSMTSDQNSIADRLDPLQKIDQRDRKAVVPKTDLVYPQALSGPPTQPAKAPVAAASSTEEKSVVQPDLKTAQKPTPKSAAQDLAANRERVDTHAAETSYCLQLASFQKLTQAQTMISTFEKKGYTDLRVVTAEVAGKGRYYRVRLGRFGDKANADAFAKKEALSAFVLKCSE